MTTPSVLPPVSDPATADDYARVERAIRYLELAYPREPLLEELAAHVGLSPFHFQRLFTRWVGISPKRFAQAQTVEHAKRLLRESRAVLETSFDVGLSGPGRLHDLFVSVEGVTPGEYKGLGRGLGIRWGVHASPFGPFLAARAERGLCALYFLGDEGHEPALARLAREWPQAVLARDEEATGEAAGAVRTLAAGGTARRAERAPLALLLKGTNLQLRVWRALLALPEGAVTSYERLAEVVGAPTAVRAVAGAVGRNPVHYLIPCHRVIRKSGGIGGYAAGTARKRIMLARECAAPAGEDDGELAVG